MDRSGRAEFLQARPPLPQYIKPKKLDKISNGRFHGMVVLGNGGRKKIDVEVEHYDLKHWHIGFKFR